MSDKIEIIKADITKLEVDAIVNAGNISLLGGGGVDGAIHRAAGFELYNECKTLGGCKFGEAKITKGYNLPCKWVIHTVGPIYNNGNSNEAEILKNCYNNSLKLATKNNIKTIAFPCISTGIYGYPFIEACKIAINTINDFLSDNKIIEKVVLVCFDEKDYNEYIEILLLF
ncbi:MAG: O-acetyl-ADP-ribose deacetylase [Clostridia bacterium]